MFQITMGGVLQKNGLGCVVWLCCLEQDEEVQDEAKKEKSLECVTLRQNTLPKCEGLMCIFSQGQLGNI